MSELDAEPRRLYYASLDDYDRCDCRGLEEHSLRWPTCVAEQEDDQ